AASPFALITPGRDDGAEGSRLTTLPGICLYAEFAYTGGYDESWLAHRFYTCAGGDLAQFAGLARFNTVPGMKQPQMTTCLAAKALLFQESLLELLLKDNAGLKAAEYYQKLAAEYGGYAEEGGLYGQLMDFYAKLARVISGKCRWHEGISAAVKTGNQEEALALAGELLRTKEETEELRLSWRDLWMAVNKPYGFEVIDGRLGWMEARMETAAARVREWTRGRDGLEELWEEPLHYMKHENGVFAGVNAFGLIATACAY
ncbi:MAG: hypothetical protein LUE87_03110, partial [Lachnospiraceae bacterium]|nr:hypothetical protein [Lachnospiraceae bacterium]